MYTSKQCLHWHTTTAAWCKCWSWLEICTWSDLQGAMYNIFVNRISSCYTNFCRIQFDAILLILNLFTIIIAVLYYKFMSIYFPFPFSCSCSCLYSLNMRLVSNDKQTLSVISGCGHYNLDYSLFYCLLLVPGVVLDVSVFMRRAYMSGVVTPLLVIRWKPPDFTGGTITNYTVSIDWDVS